MLSIFVPTFTELVTPIIFVHKFSFRNGHYEYSLFLTSIT
jgi:hypothetical protein